MYFPRAKDRLFATFLLLCLFPILFICFLFYEEAQKAVFEQYQISSESHLKLADARLSLFIRGIQEDVDALAQNPLLLEHEQNIDSLRILFLQFAHMNSMVGNVHLLRDNRSIASLYPEEGWDAADRPITFYRETFSIEQNRVWLLGREDERGTRRSVYVAQKVKDREGKSGDLLLVEIKLGQLSSWIRTNFMAENSGMMMVSPTGRIMLDTNIDMIGRYLHALPDYEIISQAIRSATEKENRVLSFRQNGETFYAFHLVSPTNSNHYIEWIPGEGMNARLDRLKLILLVTIFLVVVFSAYVSHRLSNWIGQPIYTMVRATDSLLQGDFSIRVPIEGMEEITLLEKKFNQMAEQIQCLLCRERKYMRESLDQIVRSFYLAVEMKDPYTAGHTERVTNYALILYDHLDEEDRKQFSRDDLRYATLMHDIGKVAIPDRVLLKAGKLTDEEYGQMMRHSTIGADIVEQIKSLAHVSPGVRHHHERWDGRGYPDQLKGEEIPLMGRIIAVADTFDAMTTTRSYRHAMGFQEAYAEIVRCSQTQFDPRIVAVFQKAYRSGAWHERPLSYGGGKQQQTEGAMARHGG
ncbi:HD domain-containing phosphohydrolase [Brevibacillus brevis]|uniref:HD domain-containing protein n=1 Tax=Brevibacillus brevis TaxID=1393 RepID=A0ABY9T4A1_BREBE|nr:HD domain-containing phosphohydrolase [Brevibacillus brevis]WNC14920.1 HD domain-containing protein [Brevibacillus brevis]